MSLLLAKLKKCSPKSLEKKDLDKAQEVRAIVWVVKVAKAVNSDLVDKETKASLAKEEMVDNLDPMAKVGREIQLIRITKFHLECPIHMWIHMKRQIMGQI